MINEIFRINKLLVFKEKLVIFFFILLIIIESVLELLTISLIFPILTFITNDQFFSEINLFNELLSYILTLNPYVISISLILFFSLKSIIIMIIRKYYLDFCINVTQRISFFTFDYIFSQTLTNYQNDDNAENIRNIQIIPNHFIKLLMGIITIYSEIIIISFIIIFILYYSSLINLLALIPFILTLFIYFMITKKKLEKISQDSFTLPSDLIKIIKNSIDNFLEIKILNRSKFFLSRFLEKQILFLKAYRNLVLLQLLPKYVIEISLLLFLTTTYFIIFKFGSGKNELITFYSVIVISAYRFIPSIGRIFSFIQNIKFYKPAVDKLVEWNSKYSEKNFKQKGNQYILKNIIIKNLKFQYNNNQIINGLNFQFNNNDKIFIYGSSGSGKTTFLKIFSGLIEPQEGTVQYNYKKRILNPPPLFLSKKFMYIPQNSHLFDGTIYQNISLDFSDIKDPKKKQKIINLIEEFDMSDYFQNFSNGLDTIIHSNSSTISGGQKQIISIFRALYANPKFIIFDETTNSLDSKLENKLLKRLISYKDISLIFISHKRSLKKYFKKNYEFKLKKLIKI